MTRAERLRRTTIAALTWLTALCGSLTWGVTTDLYLIGLLVLAGVAGWLGKGLHDLARAPQQTRESVTELPLVTDPRTPAAVSEGAAGVRTGLLESRGGWLA